MTNQKKEALEELFPDWEEETRTWDTAEEHGAFTTEELRTAIDKLKTNKAPGLDGIAAEIIKIAARVIPNELLGGCSTTSQELRFFPRHGKRQKLYSSQKASRKKTNTGQSAC